MLGLVVNAFELRLHDNSKVLSQKTSQRWLEGERVSDQTGIVRAVATSIVQADLFPPRALAAIATTDSSIGARLTDVPEADFSSACLATVLSSLTKQWDKVAAALVRQAAPVAFPRHAKGACLRLVATDLAFRGAAIAWLDEMLDEEPFADRWIYSGRISQWLKELLAPTTRDELARELEVHRHTIDGWFDSEVRPQDEHCKLMADAAADRGRGKARTLLRQLRLAYGLRQIFNHTRQAIGREAAEATWSRTIQLANRLLSFPRSSTLPVGENNRKMAVLVALGPVRVGQRERWLQAMVSALCQAEPDPVWRSTLAAVSGDWLRHLQSVMSTLGPSDRGELSSALGRPPTDSELDALVFQAQAGKEHSVRTFADLRASLDEVRGGGNYAALELKLWAKACLDRGDRLTAVGLFREALTHSPLNAELHFRLGACLWQLGDLDRGLGELEIAHQLEPQWDMPLVEIAVVLAARGEHSAAVKRLESERHVLSAISSWFRLVLAYLYEQNRRADEAIAQYDLVLQAEPQHAEALDRVAHLHFERGNKKTGARMAKRAAQFGIPTVHTAWRDGYYKGRPPRPRPCHVGIDDVLAFRDPPLGN